MTREQRKAIGKMGREHVDTNYSYKSFKEKWVNLMTSVHERYGSWDNRKLYKAWTFEEVA